MAQAADTVPSTAERIRSACVRGRALVAVDGTEPVSAPLCHLLRDGSVAVAVPADDAVATGAAAGGMHAVLELTDHAPLSLRERVRALVWIRGHLEAVPDTEVDDLLDQIAAEDAHPVLLQVRSPRSAATGPHGAAFPQHHGWYTLLRLRSESVVLADATGAEAVPVDVLLAARPDPFCAIETRWLRHLESSHPEVVARLATKLPAQLRRGQVRPLGVDRHGVWLRVESPDGDHDARLPFAQPVNDLVGLNRAVRVLMGCPFLNGLHARRA